MANNKFMTLLKKFGFILQISGLILSYFAILTIPGFVRSLIPFAGEKYSELGLCMTGVAIILFLIMLVLASMAAIPVMAKIEQLALRRYLPQQDYLSVLKNFRWKYFLISGISLPIILLVLTGWSWPDWLDVAHVLIFGGSILAIFLLFVYPFGLRSRLYPTGYYRQTGFNLGMAEDVPLPRNFHRIDGFIFWLMGAGNFLLALELYAYLYSIFAPRWGLF